MFYHLFLYAKITTLLYTYLSPTKVSNTYMAIYNKGWALGSFTAEGYHVFYIIDVNTCKILNMLFTPVNNLDLISSHKFYIMLFAQTIQSVDKYYTAVETNNPYREYPDYIIIEDSLKSAFLRSEQIGELLWDNCLGMFTYCDSGLISNKVKLTNKLLKKNVEYMTKYHYNISHIPNNHMFTSILLLAINYYESNNH